MSETEWFGGAYGRQLDGGPHGENELALLEVEHRATPEKVERARHFFTEATFADFEPLGTKGRRWLHRETQREFLLDESQVTDAPDPSSTGVEFFAIAAGRIWYFRARDHDPVTTRQYLGTFRAGEVVHDASGREVLKPAPMGSLYDMRA
jgi:hypothetical protein